MSDLLINTKFASLPSDMQKEVSDFIDFLQQKAKNKKPKPIKFGFAKGAIKIKPGFDEPLEDFKDYM
ncbi:MAG: DUF2281 domain-containing protein [Bacteroidetes bacterium]|nr:DUF2281 domain-containing protein [Bacteroidota bacterium]